ncbi:Nitroreductase [Anaerosphaera aminiphila DSM 21120]|uniref:Nitroreductase n=1 Tax=Anaerosphaera aminiphila DSM 21120 TaxID=1120995 RepID=A0A1M5UQK8_9FIRM|nr:nitroreductase family protein [Anaerosphaera aminiphila]SHH64963.1 Nitroreductase [Anaerosphaera aminiphila DSM 21120]
MLDEIIKDRRTIRKFEDKPVPREILEEILQYSLMGPSYGNARPVQFLVVEDKEKLKALSEIETFGTKYIADVPEVILIMADTEISQTWVEECSIAASYLQLLAQEKGLNTSWVNLKSGETNDGVEIQTFLRTLFGIPKNFSTLCMIPIGYGSEKVRKRDEFDVSSKVHYEKF